MSEPAASQSAIGTKRSGRIARRFHELGEASELGLVAYVTAGDPSLAATEKIVLAAAEAGADVIELGVPFSDPVADGPTIQRASDRALHSGTTLAGVIELVHKIRAHSDVPLILFTYFNPVLQMGLEKFAKDAASAGADGVLVTDLTPEEAEDYRATMNACGLDTIFLAAPTSTDARLERIAQRIKRVSLSYFPRGSHRSTRSVAAGFAGTGSPHAKIHFVAYRRRFRHFAANTRNSSRRNRRRCRGWLGDHG